MKELTDEYNPNKVILYHWSGATETPCEKFQVVARAFWEAIPGPWNRNISKMTAGVGYLPENYNHLYVLWTQFNPNDLSAGGNTNAELYASVSTNSGLTWSEPVNITNSPDPGCVAGDCDSDYQSSVAQRVDSFLHIAYVNDRDAGWSAQDDGTWTLNPILYYRYPVWVPPSKARIDWNPKKYFLNLPNHGIFDTDLLIYNIGTETLTGTVTTGASWIQITDGTFNIPPGPCPHWVGVRFDCTSYAETLLVDSILITSNDDVNDSVYVPAKLIVSDEYIEPQFVLESNYTFGIYESNVGNIGHQEEVGGMYFYKDDFAPLFDGSVIIGAFVDSPKVGRYIFEEEFMLAETELNLVDKPGVKTKIAKSKFYPVNPFPPESWDFWGWTVKMYDKIFYSGENDSPERFIKKVHLKIYKNPEPSWWGEDPNPDNPSVLVGMAIDFDIPSDTGNVWNTPGIDESLNLIYQQGYGDDITPTGSRYDSLYAGIADHTGSPYSAHICPNDVYVYPQSGYRDDSLYTVMSTPGFSIRDPKAPPQRTVDYNCVMTHDSIPGNLGDGDTVEVQFLIVVSTNGLKDLKDKVKMFRCGNADRDSAGQINLSDVISMAKDCFGSGDETFRYLADVNGDCQLNLTDVITLANYIFGKPVEIHCDCEQN